jgi:Tfp pilus assembly protein PilO
VKIKQIPLPLVLAIVVLVAAVAAYMVVIRPKGAEAQKLDDKIADLQTQIAAASVSSGGEEKPQTTIKVADLVELAKAMPDQTDMAGAILELNAAAKGAGVTFTDIQPGTPVAGVGYVQLPLTLSFRGNYYNLAELLYRLRQLVTVRDGVLDADGRLFTLDSLDWHEDDDFPFPIIRADLALSAYVYGNDPSLLVPVTGDAAATTAPGETAPAATTGATTTTPEGSTPTTTTPPAETTPSTVDASQQAAGATP